MSNIPRRHHTVPEFFLRRFADGDFIQLAPRDDLGRAFRTNVDNALVQSHFYSIDTDEGRSPDVETFLASHVEGPAARALRRVVDEGRFPPPPGLRDALSLFFAFQFLRGESMRRVLLADYEATAKKLGSLMTPEMARKHLSEEHGGEPSEEEVRDFVAFARNADGYRVGVSSEANLHLSGVLPIVLDLVPYFARRSWQLLTFDEPLLITGDEPVALIGRSARPGEEVLGVGTAREVAIPVDPRHAFVLARPDRSDSESSRRGTAATARILSTNVGYGCHRFVAYKPGTDPLRGLTLPSKSAAVRSVGAHVVMQGRPPRKNPRRRG